MNDDLPNLPAPIGYATENGLRQLKQDDSTVLLYPYPYLIRPNETQMFTADQMRDYARAALAVRGGSVARDREADRTRFPDPAFNRWLDEGISDAGHTVWDQIGSVVDAWHGWENRAFYTAPQAPRTLTLSDEQILLLWSGDTTETPRPVLGRKKVLFFARAVLAAAQEKP